MIPIFQKGTHDCFRACLASILNLGWLDVPDFYADVPDGHYLQDPGPMDRWFADRDLCYFEMAWQKEPAEVLRGLGEANPHITYILLGNSINGVGHAVIARGGTIIHDPAHSEPSPLSIARPCGDGYTRAGFVVIQPPDENFAETY